MSFWWQLKQRAARLAIPNLTMGLIVLQVLTYGAGIIEPARVYDALPLVADRVIHGEPWRLVTFLAMPPFSNPVCAFFFWYLFYLMGTTLEQVWGAPRYNLFLLIGYVATVGASFITPQVQTYNTFIEATVFLAFAWMFPNFELLMFFLVPVKIKYLALLQWVMYALNFYSGDWSIRLSILASVINFFLFFGVDLKNRMFSGQRHMARQAQRLRPERRAPFHQCAACGITNETNPEMEFRYCSKCHGTTGYCSRHLHAHEHIPAPAAADAPTE